MSGKMGVNTERRDGDKEIFDRREGEKTPTIDDNALPSDFEGLINWDDAEDSVNSLCELCKTEDAYTDIEGYRGGGVYKDKEGWTAVIPATPEHPWTHQQIEVFLALGRFASTYAYLKVDLTVLCVLMSDAERVAKLESTIKREILDGVHTHVVAAKEAGQPTYLGLTWEAVQSFAMQYYRAIVAARTQAKKPASKPSTPTPAPAPAPASRSGLFGQRWEQDLRAAVERLRAAHAQKTAEGSHAEPHRWEYAGRSPGVHGWGARGRDTLGFDDDLGSRGRKNRELVVAHNPRYTGTKFAFSQTKSVVLWLMDFEAQCESEGVPEEGIERLKFMFKAVNTSVVGGSGFLNWFGQLKRTVPAPSWDEVKKSFVLKFASSKEQDPRLAASALRSLSPDVANGETVRGFADRFRSDLDVLNYLNTHIKPKQPVVLGPIDLASIFLAGIESPVASQFLHLVDDVKDVGEFIDKVQKIAEMEKLLAESKKDKKTSTEYPAFRDYLTGGGDSSGAPAAEGSGMGGFDLRDVVTKLSEISQQLSGVKEAEQAKVAEQQGVARGAMQPRNNYPPRPVTNPSICYKCRQPGHFARECPNAAATLEWVGFVCSDAYDGTNEDAYATQYDDVYRQIGKQNGYHEYEGFAYALDDYGGYALSSSSGPDFHAPPMRSGGAGYRNNPRQYNRNWNQYQSYPVTRSQTQRKEALRDNRTPYPKSTSPTQDVLAEGGNRVVGFDPLKAQDAAKKRAAARKAMEEHREELQRQFQRDREFREREQSGAAAPPSRRRSLDPQAPCPRCGRAINHAPECPLIQLVLPPTAPANAPLQPSFLPLIIQPGIAPAGPPQYLQPPGQTLPQNADIGGPSGIQRKTVEGGVEKGKTPDRPEHQESYQPPRAKYQRVTKDQSDQIRLLEGLKPYDIVSFLKTLKVEGMTLAQLLGLSPDLREKPIELFQKADQVKKSAVIAENPVFMAAISAEEGRETDDGTPSYELGMNACCFEDAIGTLSVARTKSHSIKMEVDGVVITGMLDTGCCVIAISKAFLEKHAMRWSVAVNVNGYRLQTINGSAPKLGGEVHRLIGRLGDVSFTFGSVVLEGLKIPFVFGRPLFEILNMIDSVPRSLYNINWKGSWVVVDGVSGEHHNVRQLTAMEIEAWKYGQTPLYEKFRARNAELGWDLKEITRHSAGALNQVPEDEKRVHFADASQIGELPDESDPRTALERQEDFERECRLREEQERDECMKRRIYEFKGHLLSFPLPMSESDSSTLNRMDFEVASAAEFNEFVGSDLANFVKSGGSVERLLDVEYNPPDAGWTYPGEETQEEVNRFCGHLMALGMIRPIAQVHDEMEKENLLYNYDSSELKVVSWNVNGLRSWCKSGRAASLVQMSDPDVMCIQELKIDEVSMEKPAIVGMLQEVLPVRRCFTSHCMSPGKEFYSGVGIWVKDRVIKQFREPTVIQSIGDARFDAEGRIIILDFPDSGPVIVSVYAPNAGMDKVKLQGKLVSKEIFHRHLERALQVYHQTNRAVILCGDWNIAHKSADICEDLEHVLPSGCRENERKFMDSLGVMRFEDAYRVHKPVTHDSVHDKRDFTCWMIEKEAVERGRGMRFDYIWGRSSANGVLILRGCKHGSLDLAASDHVPVHAIYRYLKKVPLSKTDVELLELCLAVIRKLRTGGNLWAEELDQLRSEIRKRTVREVLKKQNHAIECRRNAGSGKQSETTGSEVGALKRMKFAGIDLNCREARGMQPTPTFEATTPKGRTFKLGDLPEVRAYVTGILNMLDRHHNEFVNKEEMPRTWTGVKEMAPEIDPSKGPLPPLRYKRMSPSELLVVKEYVRNMVKAGKMEPAVPPIWNAGNAVMAYRNGKARLCWNYPIKTHILPEYWALKPVDEVQFALARGTYMCVVDEAKGYNQCPIREDCRWMTNVQVGDQIVRSMTGPFGFPTTGASHGAQQHEILDSDKGVGDSGDDTSGCVVWHKDEKLVESVVQYRDDVGVPGKDLAQTVERFDRMLHCFDRHTGSLSEEKAILFVKKVQFVGAVVGDGLVCPIEERFKSLEKWPIPRDQTELKSFTGSIQFLSHHIPNLAGILAPLHALRKKEFNTRKKFIDAWDANPKCGEAFENAKSAAMRAVAGNVFNVNRPLILAVDTSPTAIGGVAAHASDSKDDYCITAKTLYDPCAWWSRLLRPPEANKPQPVREIIGAGWLVKASKSHRGLEWVIILDTKFWMNLMNRDDLKPSINALCTRIITYILSEPAASGYRKFIFRSGSKHGDADGLSRRPPTEEEIGDVFGDGKAKDPAPLIVDEIEEEMMPERYAIDVMGVDSCVIEKHEVYLGALQLGWEPYDSIIELLQGRGDWDWALTNDERRHRLRLSRKYFIWDECLYRRGNLRMAPRRVPSAEEVQSIIKSYHEGDDEHLGYNTITQMISKRYYWKGLVEDVKNYVRGCEVCEERRKRTPTKFELYRIVPPASLFVMLGMDTLKLPPSHGFEELVTIVDYTSDYKDATAVRGSTKGKHVVQALKTWMRHFGKPQWIVLDNAKYFVKGEFRDYCDRESIQLVPATEYNPRGNGKVENFNGTIQYTLARITLARESRPNTDVAVVAKRWYPHLDDALRVCNMIASRVTGLTPYQFVFGQEPPGADELSTDIISEIQERRKADFELLKHMREIAAEFRVQNRLEETMEEWPAPREYREGDLVWHYDVKQDQGLGVNKKILPRWKGPYQVEFAFPGGVYWLKDGNGRRISEEKINHRHLTPVRKQAAWYDYGRMGALVCEFRADEVGWGRGLNA